jgi:hypothetical protein
MLELQVDITGPGVIGPSVMLTHWAGTDQTSADAARTQMAAFLAAIKTRVTPAVTFTLADNVQVLDVTTGEPTANLTGSTHYDPYVGSAAGDALPQAVQGLLHLRTGVYIGGREVRGRINIPGCSEGDSTAGIPTAVALGNYNTAAANLLSGAGFGVWSRTHGVLEDVISIAAGTKWAVLRSRRD